MIVAVVNLKGGVAKTMTAMALAEAASRRGIHAEVVDTDPQGSATSWALSAIDSGEPLPFSVAPGNIALIRRLHDADEALEIIDLPPSGDVVDAAASKAGFVIVPTSASPADRDKTWRSVASMDKAGVPYAVLLTRWQPRTIAAREALDEIRKGGASAFDTVIPKREALSNAFGHAFPKDLCGYEAVLDELLAVLGWKEASDADQDA